jgi:hypothetical protein
VTANTFSLSLKLTKHVFGIFLNLSTPILSVMGVGLIMSLSVYGVKVLLSGKSKLFFIKYFILNTDLGYRILTTAQFIDRSPICAVTFNKPDFELVFFNFINKWVL